MAISQDRNKKSEFLDVLLILAVITVIFLIIFQSTQSLRSSIFKSIVIQSENHQEKIHDEVYTVLADRQACGKDEIFIHRTLMIADRPRMAEPDVIETQYSCGNSKVIKGALWSPGWKPETPIQEEIVDLNKYRDWKNKPFIEPSPQSQPVAAATTAPNYAIENTLSNSTAEPSVIPQQSESPLEDTQPTDEPTSPAMDDNENQESTKQPNNTDTPEPTWTEGPAQTPPPTEKPWTPSP